MMKITVSGGYNEIIAAMISKTLKDAGLSVSEWTEVKQGEVSKCMRYARKDSAQVAVLSAVDGKKL